MTTEYQEFLATKRIVAPSVGVVVDASDINPKLFEFQRDLVRWSLLKGRAALFADTGMGKTFMQLEWARLTGEPTLIVAPLTVAMQTINEAERLSVAATYARRQQDASSGITVTNYEMLDHFDPSHFGAVVLDESSILKSLDGKTRQRLTEMFSDTPYRLCCTATPAPNDIAEIANHAEFLGIMRRVDMLAAFFVHDDNGWHLKGHAVAPFYRWLASWSMSIKLPSNLGYSDDGYVLPGLQQVVHTVPTDYRPEGQLFMTSLSGIQGRVKARRSTAAAKVQLAYELMQDGDQWIAWCGLNDESNALAALMPDAVHVEGSQTPEEKQDAIQRFIDGRARVLITKARIAGFGLNFQHAHKMVFVGLNDSWESYYQCVRRCWRFGQHQSVEAHVVIADVEEEIYQNVLRKDREAELMSQHLIATVQEFERAELQSPLSQSTYRTDDASGDGWRIMLGDSSERLAEVDDNSVGLSVFSPPFLSLYSYSPSERDIGNSASDAEFWGHFSYIIDHLLRATKPGRNCCVHVSQVPAMLVRDGYIGIKDFRGDTIRAFEGRGWVYHGEVCIDKDPQAQAIRTKSKGLLFTQMRKDSSWSRPALADYILLFRKPGDNAEPIHPDITNDDWIEWARPIWYGIKETDTLNYREARSDDDEKHIAPLQLGTIERCVRLWSNPGDLVLSPFTGIGSEGYVSVKLGRRFVGCELKPEYWRMAVKNITDAATVQKRDMFSIAGVEVGGRS